MTERSEIPVSAQIQVVDKMVLPLLEKMNINVTVTTREKGLRLDLTFTEPTAKVDPVDGGPLIGTDTPDEARRMWALRQKVEEVRHQRGLTDAH